MNTKPYFKIRPDGTVTVQAPPNYQPGQGDYSKEPVKVAIQRDPFGLEIHGGNFSCVANLTKIDALGIILMLAYWLRESEYPPNMCEFVEVTK